MSAAFDRLLAAYKGRDGGWRAARSSGQKVVGYVGNTVPVEAITACGALAWRVAPIEGSTAAADAHVEAFSDLDMRLIFAQFVSGELDDLDLLIVPRSTETQHKLYLALREARRTGVAPAGPPLLLYDILHTQRPSSRSYGLTRTQALLSHLGELTGHAPTEAHLRNAIVDSNTTRACLAQLQALRRAGHVGGWQAHIATGALNFMPPQEGQRALREWLAEGHTAPINTPINATVNAPANVSRLLVKGVPLDHDSLHAWVEELGAHIVAEDDDWGSRAAEPLIDVDKPAVEALFDHCFSARPCPRIHPSPLQDSWFARTVRDGSSSGGIDGVLFNVPRPEDTYGWSLPAERALVQSLGLPSFVLRDDARDPAARAALQGDLRAFIHCLRR